MQPRHYTKRLNSIKPIYISVVVPAYNEQDRISNSLDTLIEYLSAQSYEWEIIVVDDGSDDNTNTVVQKRLNDSRIKLITLPHAGKGFAIKTGMLSAEGQIRLMCDADMAMPVSYIADFLSNINKKNQPIVIGSRQIPGSKRFNESNFRHLLGRLYNLWIKTFVISEYSDTQCGFKCFTADSVNKIFPLQRLDGFGFDIEILLIAKLMGLNTKELPIEWHHGSNSKVNPLLDSFKMFIDTIIIKMNLCLGRYNE